MSLVHVEDGVHGVAKVGRSTLDLANSAKRAFSTIVRHGHRILPRNEQGLLIFVDFLDLKSIYDDLAFLLFFLKYQLL